MALIKNLPVLPKKWPLQLIIFLILYSLYVSFDEFHFLNFYTYLFRVKGLFKFMSSIFLYGGLLVSMVMLLTSGNQVLKVISYVILILTLTIEISYFRINGYGFTYSEASVAIRETGFAMDAISTFFSRIWFVLPATLLFGIFLYWFTGRFLPKTSWKLSLPVTAFFVLLGYYVLHATTGQQTYPTMFKIPMLTVYSANNPMYMGPRDPVVAEPVRDPEYRHIIYLVDESVRGDFISLNNPSEDITPYLESLRDRILNYGIMSSGGNHSGNSQLILRSGVRSDFYPDTGQHTLRVPDILQYAKKAGYTTVYLDGQKDVLQNFMKEPERKFIDYYYGFPEKGVEGSTIDRKLADLILKHFSDTTKRYFYYVVKMGAHFHYERYYPKDQQINKPTMTLGELNNNREKMINSYRNVIRWNVDEFFRHLVENMGNRKDYLILYTSDHGQTLLDHGIISTHADVKNAHPFQACVPFFILFPDTAKLARFNYVEENYDRLSHFNLFSSLLLMMGYDTGFVRKNYDKSIFDTVSGERYFYTGMLFVVGNGTKTLFDTPEINEMIRKLKLTREKSMVIR